MSNSVLRCMLIVGVCVTVTSRQSAYSQDTLASSDLPYRSPQALVVAPDGGALYVSDATAGCVTTVNLENGKLGDETPHHRDTRLRGMPQGVALSATGETLYVTEYGEGSVAVIDTASGEVRDRIAVGKWPMAIAVANRTNRIYVANQDDHTVSVIDVEAGSSQPVARVPVVREPSCLAVTPDERHVVVANLLPYGAGTDPTLAAEVSLIDTATCQVAASVRLPPGSTVVSGVAVSPDNRWAYVVHGLGRFLMPITQLERGWVNTYALTIIDIDAGTRLATLLLDDLTQGAADPHSVACSADGTRLWISHTGVHEVSIVEVGRVHEMLAGKVPPELAAIQDGTQPNIWVRIQNDRTLISELENDLTALYLAGVIHRAPSGGVGPRGLAVSPDGSKVYVANHFSGTVTVLDSSGGQLLETISLGPQRESSSERRGEIIFHDATHAFQRWHSCASCHPNRARVDALRWDFLRDGIGNGKDTPSLILVGETAPFNRRATRESVRECAQTGLSAGHMIVPTDQTVEDLLSYLLTLRPEPSPHLRDDGTLTDAAERGKTLFHGKAHCAGCHAPPYFTDQQMHNIGVLSDNEPDGRYDTPALVEVHRTSPYLHDGRAVTLEQVLTKFDPLGRHGNAQELSADERDDLVEYLRSL